MRILKKSPNKKNIRIILYTRISLFIKFYNTIIFFVLSIRIIKSWILTTNLKVHELWGGGRGERYRIRLKAETGTGRVKAVVKYRRQ